MGPSPVRHLRTIDHWPNRPAGCETTSVPAPWESKDNPQKERKESDEPENKNKDRKRKQRNKNRQQAENKHQQHASNRLRLLECASDSKVMKKGSWRFEARPKLVGILLSHIERNQTKDKPKEKTTEPTKGETQTEQKEKQKHKEKKQTGRGQPPTRAQKTRDQAQKKRGIL